MIKGGKGFRCIFTLCVVLVGLLAVVIARQGVVALPAEVASPTPGLVNSERVVEGTVNGNPSPPPSKKTWLAWIGSAFNIKPKVTSSPPAASPVNTASAKVTESSSPNKPKASSSWLSWIWGSKKSDITPSAAATAASPPPSPTARPPVESAPTTQEPTDSYWYDIGEGEDVFPLRTTGPVPKSEVLRMIDLMNLATLAYCVDHVEALDWTCEPCMKWGPQRIEVPEVRPLGSPYSAFGFIAPSADHSHVYIGFRGTRNMKNFISDIQIAEVNYPILGGDSEVKVHYGFYHAFLEMKFDMEAAIYHYKSIFGVTNFTYTIIGHSMGGAIAQICAAYMAHSLEIPAESISVITYNSPRIGNKAFAVFMDSMPFNESLRIVNQNDWVPHLPPRPLNFFHVGTEFWVRDQTDLATGSLYCEQPWTGEAETFLSHGQDKSAMDNYPSEDPTSPSTRPNLETESYECSNDNRVKLWSLMTHNRIWGRELTYGACFVPKMQGSAFSRKSNEWTEWMVKK